MIGRTFKKEIAGIEIKATFNDLAKNANGSVLIEAGGTVVMVTATMSSEQSDKNYFPLSVEFEERFYAAGAILGSRFMRREGRPSSEATLSARIIDRTIRPLFSKDMYNDIQVIATVISLGKYTPDVLALIGASLAIGTSDIPWDGPVSGIKFTKTVDGWKPFAPLTESREYTNEILLCGKDNIITMIEMEGNQVPKNEVINVVGDALNIIKEIQSFQKEIIDDIGKTKISFTPPSVPEELQKFAEQTLRPKLTESLFDNSYTGDKPGDLWKEEIEKHDLPSETIRICNSYYENLVDDVIHTEAIENNKRVDGRALDEIRHLYAQAGGVSEIIHGSGIFYRGETHVFTALTLGSPSDALLLNTIQEQETEERFMHHYNFPPFSTGETGRVGSPNRREIGHGALAEKAIKPVLPKEETFPYTIRLVSECFSSNGSTSMASTCASTLALMDGGVPIDSPVAGIAIGLMKKDGKHVLLTDIQGPEDHHGDMDFKVARSKNGITAIQMDVKIEGITPQIFEEALDKGESACDEILQTINDAINSPRKDVASSAPTISTIKIPTDTIGLVIGKGGETIKALRTETNVSDIDINDDGTVTLSGTKENVEDAYNRIKEMTKKIAVGDEYNNAPIKTITDFGAFVEISPGKEGLVHISEFSPNRIKSVHDIASEGDRVPVVVKEIKPDGKIALSIKDRNPNFFDE